MKKERKNIFIACAMVFLALAISQSLAFHTVNVDTESIVTFGNLGLKIHETMLDENNREIPYSPEYSTPLTRDGSQSRIVRVENTGRQPMFVRVSLDMEGTDKNGETIDNADALAGYAWNQTDWTYSDGWYYYKRVLEPGSETKELMTEVMFDIDRISAEYPGGNFKLDISAQGVQSKNNEDEALKAVGWPR